MPCSGEHAHELFEGLEGLADVKYDIHLVEILEVSCKGGKMEGVVPLPGWSLVSQTSV